MRNRTQSDPEYAEIRCLCGAMCGAEKSYLKLLHNINTSLNNMADAPSATFFY